MAKQSRDETISSVSDILGFILEQSEKEPDKRRPVKPETGDVQAESEYVSAVVDALAMPGTFVGEQTLGTVQSLVDAEIKLKTQGDRIGSIKIKASDLPTFFDNPDDFVDRLFEGNRKIAKMQRLRWAGEQMRMLAGSTYAKKLELFDSYSPEMKNVLERALGQSAMEGKEADRIWMVEAANDIKENGYIKSKLEGLYSQLESAQYPEVRKKLQNQIDGIESKYKGAMDVGNKYHNQNFKGLLKDEFRARQEEVLGGRDKKDLTAQEIREYEKMETAQATVDLWGQYDGLPNSKRDFNRIQSSIISTKNALINQRRELEKGGIFTTPDGKRIDYSQYSKDQKNEELRAIKGRIKDLNTTSRDLNRTKFWSNIGRAEGTYYGIKNTFGSGGVEAILNGDFFDPKYDYFGSPSVKGKFDLLGYKDGEDFSSVEFVTPIKIEGRNLTNGYNEAMVGLYYMNPVTWIKSLATGEAFAWMAHKEQQKLAEMWGVKAGMFTELKDRKFWQFYKKFKGASEEEREALFATNPKYRELMGRLMKVLGDKDSDMSKKFAKAEKLFASLEKWGGLAKVFSAPARLKAKVIDKFQQKIRNGVFNILSKMKMFSGDKAAMALLESWKLTGGKALTGAISKAIVGALGLAGTAVGGPLGTAISLAVATVLDKVLKVSIKVFIYGFVGVFGLIMVLASVFTYNKRASVDAYSRELPGEVYYSEEFTSYGGGDVGLSPIDEDGDWEGGGEMPPFVPGNLPAGMSCLFTSGPDLRCSQGPYSSCSKPGFKQPSHRNSPAIDVAVGGNFAAPQFCDLAKGNCVVESVGQGTCGGGQYPAGGYVTYTAQYQGREYRFYILHVSYGVSTGQKLGPGQAVATIADDPSWRMCSSGLHAHLTIQVDGSYASAEDALNVDFNCSLGDCPVNDVCYILE